MDSKQFFKYFERFKEKMVGSNANFGLELQKCDKISSCSLWNYALPPCMFQFFEKVRESVRGIKYANYASIPIIN